MVMADVLNEWSIKHAFEMMVTYYAHELFMHSIILQCSVQVRDERSD